MNSTRFPPVVNRSSLDMDLTVAVLRWCWREVLKRNRKVRDSPGRIANRITVHDRSAPCGRAGRMCKLNVGPETYYPYAGHVHNGRPENYRGWPALADRMEGLVFLAGHEFTHYYPHTTEANCDIEGSAILEAFKPMREGLERKTADLRWRCLQRETARKIAMAERRGSERKAEAIAAKVADAQARIRRLQAHVKRLQRKLRYYERRAAAKRNAAVAGKGSRK